MIKKRNRTIKYINHIKLLSILVCGILIIELLSACSLQNRATEDAGASAKLSVVATAFAGYDFARSVAGDVSDITMLLKPGEDVHSFEPTPQDIIAIQNADVFIYVGGENDSWVDSILEGMDTGNIHIIRMLDLVNLYEEEATASDSGDQEEWDEHVWTSPQNAMIIARAIADTCIEVSSEKGLPSYQAVIEEATDVYLAQLSQLDEEFRSIVQESTRKVLVFADRFPLRYFTEAYGLDYVALFPGCSAESECSARKLASLIDYVKDNGIPVVFKIELSNDNMLRTVEEETGCRTAVFYSCHNVSLEDYNSGETYLSLMHKNADILKEALN